MAEPNLDKVSKAILSTHPMPQRAPATRLPGLEVITAGKFSLKSSIETRERELLGEKEKDTQKEVSNLVGRPSV